MTSHAVALVGSGAIAEQHLGALLDLKARVAVVYSRTAEKAKKLAERAGCGWTTDWREAVRHPEVDLVDVVTSSGSHAEIGLGALDAGKHLLVEKPLAMTTADVDRLLARATEKRRMVSVVSQRRFEEQHVAVKKALDEGAIGKLLLAEVSCPYYRTQAYYDSADWRGKIATDGGALMNQSIHSIDLLLWFAGPAASVVAKTATQTHRMEAEDLALAIVTFRSGAFGTILASTSIQPGFPPALNLYGEKGTIKLEGAAVAHWTVPGREKPAVQAPASAGIADPKLSSHAAHRAQIADVLAALDEGRPPSVTGEDGRRAVALVEAVYRSSASGAAVSPA
ncbi:MAG TPA: Gfo/Idh/MocA family oxidoreductase [Planctomycetota bacterium]|nr:Gfo/Idh/MocA family oxidoreductase [Planctomycetota bacterium]